MGAYKSILVHADASARCVVRLRLAKALASRLDATLGGVYAATPSALTAAVALGEGSSILATAAAESDAQHRRAARMAFDSAGLGRGAEWRELAGDLPIPAFTRAALTADLLVLGQPDDSDAGAAIVPSDFAESVLIASGKPSILVPSAGDFVDLGKTVLVAWKPTRESARAIAAAMPLLQMADHVHVAAWGAEPREVEAWLRRHGVAATLHRESTAGSEVGEMILSRAADLGADLLVMGCYGHSRAREMVLGGASRTIIDSMTIPVLMTH
jgi:nucleotide-binding universal stress UspA family protein